MIELVKPFPSPLDKLHSWRRGDHVHAVDGRPVEDLLDLYYFMPRGQEMTLTIHRAAEACAAPDAVESCEMVLRPGALDQVMSCFAAMEFKTCACDCVFCFIDQNPQGMRPSIYVKDEDHRLSFLYGNYITLTSIGRSGIKRVIEQRMTPLYVSVHATDVDVRTRMLGIRKRIDVMAVMRELVENGIEIHTQIVLCPGWNDGDILDKSIADLSSLHPGIGSLAVVPVGLSAHRDGLTQLDPVTPEIARDVVRQVERWREKLDAANGSAFVHLSDEFYLLAGEPFPPAQQYEDFPQIDNGIGLTLSLRDAWAEDLDAALADGDGPRTPLTILTGSLAAKAFAREFAPLFARDGLPPVEVRPVENNFYGSSVTVAGLLTGGDIKTALAELPAAPVRTVLLPPRMFNSDDLTLDGMNLAEIAAGSPHRLLISAEEGFIDFWRGIG